MFKYVELLSFVNVILARRTNGMGSQVLRPLVGFSKEIDRETNPVSNRYG